MKKMLQLLVAVLIGVVIAIGLRWYAYISNTKSPYDEVGIELNRYMPAPLRAWGCGKLHANFQRSLPPSGCGYPDAPKDWMP